MGRSDKRKNQRISIIQEFYNKSKLGKKFIFISIYAVIIIILFSALRFFAIPMITDTLVKSSPFYKQSLEIKKNNNINDAFSGISGTDIDRLPQVGIIKWFNNKEAKNIQVYVPKIINYSPLFDDEKNTKELKRAIKNSVIPPNVSKSTNDFEVYYNNSKVIDVEDGKVVFAFDEISENDMNQIKQLIKEMLFKKKNLILNDWVREDEIEKFTFKNNKVDAEFYVGKLIFKKKYNIHVDLSKKDNQWVINNSKVKEIK